MPRRIKHYPALISEDELNKLIETILNDPTLYPANDRGTFLRWRDRTAILMTYYAGLRPGEALHLRWEDIDFQARKIRILPYFNKERMDIPAVLTKPAMRVLESYKKILNSLGFQSPFLFPSIDDFQPLTTDRLNRIIKQAGEKAGIVKVEWLNASGQAKHNITSYTGRHWFATQVYKTMKSDVAVQQLMRHKNRESSQYYVHLAQENKLEIADAVFG